MHTNTNTYTNTNDNDNDNDNDSNNYKRKIIEYPRQMTRSDIVRPGRGGKEQTNTNTEDIDRRRVVIAALQVLPEMSRDERA